MTQYVTFWVVAFLLWFIFVGLLGEYIKDQFDEDVVVAWIFIAVLVGSCIYWDLYHKMPFSWHLVGRWLIMMAITTLGTLSIGAFVGAIKPNRKQSYRQNQQSDFVGLKVLMSLVGFVSSVLGILSFYLQYLR
jgi:hypothetical protein